MAGTVKTIALDDDTSTRIELWGSAGPILLCVHGIGSSRKSWARTAEYFAASYRVAAYDQRGHGDAADVGGPMTLERAAADCAAVAKAVGEPIHALIGHSWGGAVALLAGLRDIARGVIAVDPMIHQPPGRWYADFVDDLLPLFAVPPPQRAAAIRRAFADLPAIEIDAKVHALERMTIRPIVRLGEDNAADFGRWDIRLDLRRYPLPALLLLADPAESVVSAEDLFIVRETIGPNGTIEVFDGEGHTLQRTAFARYAEAVAEFVARIENAPLR